MEDYAVKEAAERIMEAAQKGEYIDIDDWLKANDYYSGEEYDDEDLRFAVSTSLGKDFRQLNKENKRRENSIAKAQKDYFESFKKNKANSQAKVRKWNDKVRRDIDEAGIDPELYGIRLDPNNSSKRAMAAQGGDGDMRYGGIYDYTTKSDLDTDIDKAWSALDEDEATTEANTPKPKPVAKPVTKPAPVAKSKSEPVTKSESEPIPEPAARKANTIAHSQTSGKDDSITTDTIHGHDMPNKQAKEQISTARNNIASGNGTKKDEKTARTGFAAQANDASHAEQDRLSREVFAPAAKEAQDVDWSPRTSATEMYKTGNYSTFADAAAAARKANEKKPFTLKDSWGWLGKLLSDKRTKNVVSDYRYKNIARTLSNLAELGQ